MQAERLSCEQVAELSAALALDSVEPSERAALEAHLAECQDCRRAQDALAEVAAELALGLPRLAPPPALGERLLREARRDLEAAPTPRPLAGPGQPSPTAWRRFERWSPAIALGALAAAVAALIWGASLQTQLDQSRQQLAAVSAQLESIRGNYGAVVQVLASESTQVRELQAGEAAPSALGKLWIDSRTGQGMMMARDLPPLPEGQGYQVWLANERGRISPGFLRAYAQGVYYLVLSTPDPLTDYRRIGVTREPLPGSPGPTTPRIVGADL